MKINFLLSHLLFLSLSFSAITLRRLLATAPSVKKTIWGLTQFVMANLHQLFIPRFGYGGAAAVDDTEYTDKFNSIYDDDPLLKQFKHLEHRKSIMSLVDADESDFEVRGGMLSRRNSMLSGGRNSAQPLMVSSFHSTDVDTLDQVVNVCSAHPDSTLYSYHYIDETDKTVSGTGLYGWEKWILEIKTKRLIFK